MRFRTGKSSLVAGLAVIAVAVPAVVVAGCGSSSGGSKSVALVAYSTPKEAYAALVPAFQKTPGGKGVSFTQSYGASGDQERAVEAGLHADVVALSLAPDVDKLVKAGLVAPTWSNDAWGGFVTDSVVVFAVRKGNPKHIRSWADVVKPGVKIVTPNPFTSGGARWNVMAAYGAQIEQGKKPAQALAFVKALLHNTVAQDKSARDALQTFAAGKGDVLLAYENEAIAAQKKGIALDYVIPDQTILIQNPVAVTKAGAADKAAVAFVAWLRTPAAQQLFVAKGYRSVLPALADPQRFPVPKGLFRITALGGWKKVNKAFFDPQKGALVSVEQSLGVPTAK